MAYFSLWHRYSAGGSTELATFTELPRNTSFVYVYWVDKSMPDAIQIATSISLNIGEIDVAHMEGVGAYTFNVTSDRASFIVPKTESQVTGYPMELGSSYYIIPAYVVSRNGYPVLGIAKFYEYYVGTSYQYTMSSIDSKTQNIELSVELCCKPTSDCVSAISVYDYDTNDTILTKETFDDVTGREFILKIPLSNLNKINSTYKIAIEISFRTLVNYNITYSETGYDYQPYQRKVNQFGYKQKSNICDYYTSGIINVKMVVDPIFENNGQNLVFRVYNNSTGLLINSIPISWSDANQITENGNEHAWEFEIPIIGFGEAFTARVECVFTAYISGLRLDAMLNGIVYISSEDSDDLLDPRCTYDKANDREILTFRSPTSKWTKYHMIILDVTNGNRVIFEDDIPTKDMVIMGTLVTVYVTDLINGHKYKIHIYGHNGITDSNTLEFEFEYGEIEKTLPSLDSFCDTNDIYISIGNNNTTVYEDGNSGINKYGLKVIVEVINRDGSWETISEIMTTYSFYTGGGEFYAEFGETLPYDSIVRCNYWLCVFDGDGDILKQSAEVSQRYTVLKNAEFDYFENNLNQYGVLEYKNLKVTLNFKYMTNLYKYRITKISTGDIIYQRTFDDGEVYYYTPLSYDITISSNICEFEVGEEYRFTLTEYGLNGLCPRAECRPADGYQENKRSTIARSFNFRYIGSKSDITPFVWTTYADANGNKTQISVDCMSAQEWNDFNEKLSEVATEYGKTHTYSIAEKWNDDDTNHELQMLRASMFNDVEYTLDSLGSYLIEPVTANVDYVTVGILNLLKNELNALINNL